MIPRKILAVRRYTNAQKIDYNWEKNTPTARPNYKASVQPADAKILETLPEGRRNYESYLLYGKPTDINVLSDSVQFPDEVFIYGDWYQFTKESKWTNNIINHHWYLVQKVTTK